MATEQQLPTEPVQKLVQQGQDLSKAAGKLVTDQQPSTEPLQELEEQGRPLSQAAGKLVLASIGGVALAQDALEGMLHRMVERGELSRKQARRRMEALRAKRPKLSRSGVRDLTDSVRDAAELPSKADIQGLHDQIADLSAKLDQLTQEKAAAALPTPPKSSLKP